MSNIRNIILICLALLFAYLLLYGFPDSPSPWFDEGINLGVAKSLVKHGIFSLETAPNEFVEERSLLITTNYPLLLWIALFFKIFGIGLWQAKIVMFAFLLIFICLFYLLAKKYYGKDNALASLAILITFLPFYGNGKSALGEIPGLAYFLGGLLLWDSEKRWKIFIAGALFGLAAATKPLYLLLLIGVLLGEVFIAFKNKKINYHSLLLLGCGAALPILIWLYTLLPQNLTFEYLVRTWQLYRNPYNIESAVYDNVLRFFTESTPIHFAAIFLSVLWFLFKKHKNKEGFRGAEIALASFAALNLVFYLKTAGWYRYFFPAHVLLFILFPPALMNITQRFNKVLLAALVVVQVVVVSTNLKSSLYYNPAPRQFVAEVNRAIPEGQGIFVVDLPEIAFLLNRDDVTHYLRANPHIAFGHDLFAENQYPMYVISGVLPPGGKYDITIDGGKYVLYERKK